MACKYIYKEKEYSKEDLLEILKRDDALTTLSFMELRSIATTAVKNNKMVDMINLLQQRSHDLTTAKVAEINHAITEKEKIAIQLKYDKLIADVTDAIQKATKVKLSEHINYVLTIAENDQKIVEAAFNNDEMKLSDFNYVSNIVETWSSINNILNINSIDDLVDGEVKTRVKNIKAQYGIFSDKVTEATLSILDKNFKVDAEGAKIKDIFMVTRKLRGIGITGIPLANKLSTALDKIALKTNAEQGKNRSIINEKEKLIANNQVFKKEGWSLFVRKRVNKLRGDTLNLVSKYTQKFWDDTSTNKKELENALKIAKGNDIEIKKAWKTYNEWYNKNTDVFNALYFLEAGKYSDSERNQEINKFLGKGFTKSEIDTIIAGSEKLFKKFNYDKKAYEEGVLIDAVNNPQKVPSLEISNTPTEKEIDDYVKKMVDAYDMQNNPLHYYDQKFFGAQVFTAYKARKFIHLIPVKTINGKDAGYYDSNFAKIANDKDLFEFYTWFVEFMDEQLGSLPEEETKHLGPGFLATISSRLTKEYGLTELKESISGLGDWFLKSMTAIMYSDKTEINPITKKERKTIKTAFLNEAALDVDDRSDNLIIIAKMFSDMAVMFKHRNNAKETIKFLDSAIQNTKGSYKIDNFGKMIETDDDATNIKSLATSTVNALFYGITPKDVFETNGKDFYNWKELVSFGFWESKKGKEAKKLKVQIEALKKELEDDTLSEGDKKKKEVEINILKSEHYRLGGRHLSVPAIIDSLVSQTRLGALALKPFSAFRNLMVGKINNRVHAAGGLDLTTRTLLLSNKIILGNTLNYVSLGNNQTENVKKIGGLLMDSGLIGIEDVVHFSPLFDKKTLITSVKALVPKAFTLLSSGDYHFKAELLVGCALHDKVKTSIGDISFWDVIDSNREYDEKKYGVWNKDDNGGLTFEEYKIKKLIKYKKLAHKLHGASGKNVHIQLKEDAIGRVLMLFKSWIPETVGVRFDPKYFDDDLGRTEQGYYLTFWDTIKDKKLGVFQMMLNVVIGREVNGIADEVMLANFKKAVKELQVILTVYILYLLAKAMAPDDDERRKLYNLFILRQLDDLRRDLTYYSSIDSADDLQKSVFPIFRTIKNYKETMKAVTYYMAEVENDKGEIEYDWERTLLKVTKPIPIINNKNTIEYYLKDSRSDF